ncbi:hypothetical protein PSQ19_13120 [Devosia algicola]|uniref:STAS domain-containing protein n=1 Tax=Devosia algicola TaxID=3026418 RepID=A0ABY7YKB1_9HYPH|nr:hypothetical protein [Devosia algicola]WDR01683.1 hypothetical protein PSQ19_13120 [Devosia algicola]
MVTTAANAHNAGRNGPFYRRTLVWLGSIDDGSIMRFAFFALLFGTLSVLYVDFRELTAADTALAAPLQPILPPFSPGGPDATSAPEITTDPAILRAPLVISLEPGGILRLTGTIEPGSDTRFAKEIAARGEYVETVSLDSPGGSVMDALAIGALIRDKGFATEVAAGALCASSCPLVLAGGVERLASDKAAIGVHQIYAAAMSTDPVALSRTAGLAISSAQSTTARVSRYLTSSGVDPALWLHALETPPDRLYYLSTEETRAPETCHKDRSLMPCGRNPYQAGTVDSPIVH